MAWGSVCQKRAIVEILDLSWALKSLEHHFENYLCPGPHPRHKVLTCLFQGWVPGIDF